MKVKVQCDCGTRFEFEVEPVNDRMPVPIACPECSADATALANAVIKEHLASPPPAAPVRTRVDVRQTVPPPQPAAVPVPAAPAQSGLRISKPAGHVAPTVPAQTTPAATPIPAAASADEGAPKLCPRHKTESAFETCVVCGKPICPKCMEQFGYVCSVYCKSQAATKRIYVPVYAHQKSAVEERSRSFGKLIAAGVFLLLLGIAGLWFWYTFYARDPKVVYSVLFPKQDSSRGVSLRSGDFYELIGPNELLSIKNKQLSLMDVTEAKSLWTVPLSSEAEQAAAKAARAKSEEVRQKANSTRVKGSENVDFGEFDFEEAFAYFNPRVLATTNDIWIAGADRLARFDRKTGAPKEIPLKDQIRDLTFGKDAIFAITKSSDGRQSLTRISLSDGAAQSEAFTAGAQIVPAMQKTLLAGTKNEPSAEPAKAAQAKAIGTVIANAQSGGLNSRSGRNPSPASPPPASASSDDEDFSDSFLAERHPYIAAGPNAVQLDVKMLEHKTIAREAMKAKGKSILESGNITASQGLDLAQEMANDAERERTGGKEVEDVSRYLVTLHRYFSKDTPDWTGEVIGPTSFFPLQTVDVLAAGQTIYVFNKNNKKLWEAKLTYPVDRRPEPEHATALETNGALYVADIGMLTCFELTTGTARWRLNSIGINNVQADERGRIYVNSTTAGPDKIRHSLQVNLRDKIYPLMLQVDPKTGKVLWRKESLGDECLLSGKFVYCTRHSTTIAALRLEEGPDTHFNLNLLSPSSGDAIWNFRRTNRSLLKAQVQKNWILLQFADEVLVMKFFSL